MCPDRAFLALDIAESILASRDWVITGIEKPHD
jgi:hypothetical protein